MGGHHIFKNKVYILFLHHSSPLIQGQKTFKPDHIIKREFYVIGKVFTTLQKISMLKISWMPWLFTFD